LRCSNRTSMVGLSIPTLHGRRRAQIVKHLQCSSPAVTRTVCMYIYDPAS
jgi:hypothetical protein